MLNSLLRGCYNFHYEDALTKKQKEKPLYYIAGPYTHKNTNVQDQREIEHSKISAELLKNGYLIYSPIAETIMLAKHGKLIGTDWDTWREKDLKMLERCDELLIINIDGWQQSRGVKGEVKYCFKNNKPVSLLDVGLMAIFTISKEALLREFGVKHEDELND